MPRLALLRSVGVMTESTKPGDSAYGWWGAGIAVGMGIGVAIGVAMGNIGGGIAIGAGIGVAFGVAFTEAAKRKPENPSGDERDESA